MQVLLSIMLLLALPTAFVVVVIYFFALHKFAHVLAVHNPQALVLVREKQLLPASQFQAAYQVLRGVKQGCFHGVKLSPEAMAAWARAKRLLYFGTAIVFVLVMSGLAISVTKA